MSLDHPIAVGDVYKWANSGGRVQVYELWVDEEGDTQAAVVDGGDTVSLDIDTLYDRIEEGQLTRT